MAVESSHMSDTASNRRRGRRTTVASSLGTFMEYFDFGIYAYVAVFISPLFFPSENSAASLLSTLAVFAVAYLIRPLGGVYFGHMGDRVGRRKTLIVTVVCMGVATTAIGLLPTYAQVGVLAPVLLVMCRLLQGFSAGGEVGGAATYVIESSPSSRRGFHGSFVSFGAVGGFAGAAACVGLIAAVLSDEQMASWGWRVPFLIALPMAVACMFARLKLEDSPEFTAMQQNKTVEEAPLRLVFRTERGQLLRVTGMAIAQNGGAYIVLTFLSIFMSTTLGFNPSHVLWLVVGAALVAMAFIPLFGRLSDQFGRRPLLALGYSLYIVLPYPALWAMSEFGFVACIFGIIALALPLAITQAVGYPTYAEAFGTRVRYSGIAMAFNIGAIAAGGTAPYAGTWLVNATGSPMSPAFFVMLVAVIGMVSLRGLPETAQSDLRR